MEVNYRVLCFFDPYLDDDADVVDDHDDDDDDEDPCFS